MLGFRLQRLADHRSPELCFVSIGDSYVEAEAAVDLAPWRCGEKARKESRNLLGGFHGRVVSLWWFDNDGSEAVCMWVVWCF